jgi:2-methylisocitrate lyase-like PEP mutase family enzyme
MHVEPPILVLPNAWDVASAKALAAIDGCRALATSSAAVARSLGFEDGERAPGALMVEAAGRIAQAVDVPVTGDLERGYGDPVGTARAAWEAGLVGINFEDSTRAGLVGVEEQAAATSPRRPSAGTRTSPRERTASTRSSRRSARSTRSCTGSKGRST